MFTDGDYRAYFATLKNADGKMIQLLDTALTLLDTPGIIRVLTQIRNQEYGHMRLEDELFKILDEVITVKK